jgi:hypothetical protein
MFSLMLNTSDSLHVCFSGPTNIYINLTTLRIRQQIHLQTGEWGCVCVAQDLRKTQKLPQKLSDCKRSISIIHVHFCALLSMHCI